MRPVHHDTLGDLLRASRKAKGWTLTVLGRKTGYSAAQISRYERGISSMTDVDVLRRFADALGLAHETFGLIPPDLRTEARHARPLSGTPLRLPTFSVGALSRLEGDDPVRRRNMLAGLAATTTAAVVGRHSGPAGARGGPDPGGLLVARLREAMLGMGPASPREPTAHTLAEQLGRATADFDACRYTALAGTLPRTLSAGHVLTTGDVNAPAHCVLTAKGYLLATRTLIKLDEQQLGWMAADRARQLAESVGDIVTAAECSRQLAVLARKAGWHREALLIALSAADDPGLRAAGDDGKAQRGLLVQSAAYTLARSGDRDGMRELTAEAAELAKELGAGPLLRDHGGGFGPLTVRLHRISAENHAGDPRTALAAARDFPLAALPTTERRSRALGDIATAHERLGQRAECLRALLAAERCAPQETRARPATRALISGLLLSGPTSSELRELATRCGAFG